MINKQIHIYNLTRKIGSGGMGLVHLKQKRNFILIYKAFDNKHYKDIGEKGKSPVSDFGIHFSLQFAIFIAFALIVLNGASSQITSMSEINSTYIANTNLEGEDKDMIDVFEEIFAENNLRKSISAKLAIREWRRSTKNDTIRWTEQEQEELRYHIGTGLGKEKIDSKDTIRKAEILIDIMEYKRRYEVQEAKDRKGMVKSTEQILKQIQKIDFGANVKIKDSYVGKSPYIVIIIPQKHTINSKGASADILEIQEHILGIQKKLNEEGLARYSGYEGFLFIEKSQELPRYATYFDTPEISPSRYYEDQFEKEGGLLVHSFGLENEISWDKSSNAANCYEISNEFYKEIQTEMYLGDILMSVEQYLKIAADTLSQKEKVTNKAAYVRFVEQLEILTKDKPFITTSTHLEIMQYFKDEFVKKTLNLRNYVAVQHIEDLYKNTLAKVYVVKFGALHIFEKDSYEIQKTIPQILLEKDISYIVLQPTQLQF